MFFRSWVVLTAIVIAGEFIFSHDLALSVAKADVALWATIILAVLTGHDGWNQSWE